MAKDNKEALEEKEMEINVPGKGVLYGASLKILQETTRFTELEVYMFAVRQTKIELCKGTNRMVSEIYIENIMRNKISATDDDKHGGAGRADILEAMQIEKTQIERANTTDYHV